MGTIANIKDGLINALSGMGMSRDVRTASAYSMAAMTQYEIAAAYSQSGLLKKIVRIPALDMVREWREWTGVDAEQSAALYEHEKLHMLRQKILQAETLRGLGGGAIILGLSGNPFDPAPESVAKGGMAYINVVSRWHLNFDAIQDDATLPGYGEPVMWSLNSTNGQQRIHPSRVIPFRADCTASLAMPGCSPADAFWGESTVSQVLDAVKDSDTARASFAALMHKARLLRIGIPGLMQLAASPDGESTIQKRMQAVVMAESIHNATIYDAGNPETGQGGETISEATYSFAGAKDILNTYAEFVAAISDIPATRLLGRAPDGMNSSGESQQADWNKRVRAIQTLELGPCLDRLDKYLVPSAIGARADSLAYEFAPLDTPDQAAIAARFKTQMEASEKLQAMNAVPDEAFNRGLQSLLVQEGYLPELELALAELPDDERYGVLPVAAPGSGLETAGGPTGSGSSANDASPRPLYVRRNLLNAGDLIKWAKVNGLETTLPADDMHVTVLFSRNAVDPITMGEPLYIESDGGLVVKAGGPRALEQFGEGAIVLQFAAWALNSRHDDMIRAGASHDYPEYLPHVTITYSAPDGFDIEAVKPYAGELRFGPEIFEPLDLDWKDKIEEA